MGEEKEGHCPSLSLCPITSATITERERAEGYLSVQTLIKSQGFVCYFTQNHTLSMLLLFGKFNVMHMMCYPGQFVL